MKPSPVLILVVAVLVAAGCSAAKDEGTLDGGLPSDAGLDTAAMTDGAKDSGDDGAACKLVRPYSTKTPVCNTCAEQGCCALLNTCLNDDGCDNGYVDCILACALTSPGDAGADADVDAGIASCESDCGTQYPTGRDEYVVATACVDSKCATPCK